MKGKIRFSLIVILFSTAIVPVSYAQPSQESIGKILGYEGQVLVIRGEDEEHAEIGMPVKKGDTIKTGASSKVGVLIEVTASSSIRFDLREDSQVKVEDLCLLVELEGEIKVKTEGERVECRVNTARENIGTSGTQFVVKTRDAGTIVDVSEGQVKLTRKGEVVGTNIIPGYEALVPKDQLLTVVSSKPLHTQLGLSLVMPGTGNIYAGRNIGRSLIVKAMSTIALVGLFTCEGGRGSASEASIRAYDDYKVAIEPGSIIGFYDRHQENVKKARRFRNCEIGLAFLYVGLLAYEMISTIQDDKAYRKMIKESSGLGQEDLYNPRADLEIRDDAILSRAYWYIE